ncbi:MAG: MFS transporter [Acidobacteriota bacterium]|nr:MFS transporter [Acidobacteriota bacterium]
MISRKSSAGILICGGVILAIAIGIRLAFGLFLQPVSEAHGWGREIFALAIALQNIVWGLTQPFLGILADKLGARKVVVMGGIGYSIGLYLMSQAASPLALYFTTGVLIGLSLSATSFVVVLGAVGRVVNEKHRSAALGLVSAGGSLGQVLILPFGQALLGVYGWVLALTALAAVTLLMVPLAIGLGDSKTSERQPVPSQPLGEAVVEAGLHRGYWLLTAGFFVCGFQVTFMATHLPAYIVDLGFSARLGATALALIALINVIGSSFWGFMGGKYSKKYNLTLLYLARALVIAAFLFFPPSNFGILIFASAMGFLWLGTVPLTSGLIGQIFGVQYLSTLFGIVFLGHQVGAFVGVWMGGAIFDATGSYDMVWYVAIGLGLTAALLHWPINEAPVERLAQKGAVVL